MTLWKTAAATAVSLALFAGTALAEDCKPSKWGADDEIGSANLVTPERTLAASKLVKQGKSVPLGIVIDSKTPAFPPRGLSLQVVQPNQQGGQKLFAFDGNYNDDLMQLWLGIGSQIDGLGHLGENGLYYNCLSEKEISQITGLTKLGTHNIPPLVGRGVVLDMAKHFGVESLEAGKYFTAADIQEAAKAQGIEIREGDVVLFYTGWTDAKLASDPVAWASGEPGTSEDAAEWLAAQNVMAVGSDTWGLDVIPPEKEGRPFYGHVTLLKKNGIYILETMNTGPLVREGVTEFMFVLGQARVRGTVQMIINPVALY
ncbi:cyclase family protein [Sneathiella sp. CAU 1612]|uniref:Cyclase family protein n=1 Tax=Sneathiella sedimenti TaxID=2816034 RepID=A0ABS3F5A3_9PROT|nr:cyclase family protein [Sneathiella sedimenti]MBO0333527.1 cyclase family protein [Sneathiella sedimenti]